TNPSFLCLSPDNRFLYAVNEDADSLGRGGMVSSYRVRTKKGRFTLLNQVSSGGNHPCYVSILPNSKTLYVANYSTGSIGVYGIQKNGALDTLSQLISHVGKSINKNRQERAHVHATYLSTDGNYLFAPDLGMDKLMLYKTDFNASKITPHIQPHIAVRGGAGPRHVVMHPNQQYVYLTEELTGTLSVFSFKEGSVKLMQTISTVAEDYKGSFGVADIHISEDGKFVYASNRGDANNIVIYAVDTNTGLLSTIGFQATLGIKPRNFSIDPTGNFLLVANQESDNIVIFKRDSQTGLLTDTGKRISVPNPVCLVWSH
ncbi:MAG: hypothetical protein RLY16_1598, partial [Bacteroidota bacterium]